MRSVVHQRPNMLFVADTQQQKAAARRVLPVGHPRR